jgi:hypothetical protein
MPIRLQWLLHIDADALHPTPCNADGPLEHTIPSRRDHLEHTHNMLSHQQFKTVSALWKNYCHQHHWSSSTTHNQHSHASTGSITSNHHRSLVNSAAKRGEEGKQPSEGATFCFASRWLERERERDSRARVSWNDNKMKRQEHVSTVVGHDLTLAVARLRVCNEHSALCGLRPPGLEYSLRLVWHVMLCMKEWHGGGVQK